MSNSPLGQCRETVLLWLGFSSKNTVMIARKDAKIGVFQEVYLPSHSEKGCVEHSGQKVSRHLI